MERKLMVKIELTEDEAFLFRAFMEHHETFSEMLSAGVFNIRSGDAILNFDENGVLNCVTGGNIPLFRRGRKQLQYIETTKLPSSTTIIAEIKGI